LIKQIEITVTGKVQGVFFRETTKGEASKIGIVGTVKNLPNGNQVFIVAQGEEEKLAQLIGWCHQGSPAAVVEKVEVIDVPVEDRKHQSFEIDLRR
jgi:acylphosphatase